MPTKKLASIMEAYLASAQVPSEPPVKASPAQTPVVPMSRWILEDKKRLRKVYTFEGLAPRNEFVRQVLSLEEAMGKSKGEVYVVGLDVTVRVWTRETDTLSELDKEHAQAIDTVFKDVVCPLPSIYLRNTVG
jgi:pterin-4a-carbinolamine dehydratase